MVRLRDAAQASSLVIVGESMENLSVGAAMVRRLLSGVRVAIEESGGSCLWLLGLLQSSPDLLHGTRSDESP
jgi:hypothetical protein